MFDTKARVLFPSAAEATEKHVLFREKQPTDQGVKIFANRAQPQTDKRETIFFVVAEMPCLSLRPLSTGSTFAWPSGQ
eukprot:2197838-Amphidinium_carterae.1